MHWCMDETLAVLAMIPFIGYFFSKLHAWWHKHFHHKCHEEGCNAEHVEHCHMPANIPHGHVGQEQCEQHPDAEREARFAKKFAAERVVLVESYNESEEESAFTLTHRGLVAGAIIAHGPMTHEQIVALHPNEDTDVMHTAINEMVEEGRLVLDGDLLKEGDLFK